MTFNCLRSAQVAFVAAFTFIAAIANRDWWSRDLALFGDPAAATVHAHNASHFSQLYGVPSFAGYYHLGPAVLYFRGIVARVLGSVGVPFIPAILAAHLLFTALALLFGLWLARALFGAIGGVLALAAVAGIAILSPVSIYSAWEPHGAGLFTGLCMLAAAGIAFRPNLALPVAIVLGGLAAHQLLSFAWPVVGAGASGMLMFVLRGKCVGAPVRWPLLIVSTAIAIVVMASPLWIDALFLQGTHWELIAWASKHVSSASRPTMAVAFQNIGSHLGMGPTSTLFALLVAPVAFACLSWASTERRYPALVLFVVAYSTILASLAFYLFLSPDYYAPPHTTTFMPFAAAMMVVSFLLGINVPIPNTVLCGLTVVAGVGLVGTYFWSPTRYRQALDTAGYASSPAMHEAADRAPNNVTIWTSPIRSGTSFATREYPWRAAVGLGLLLRLQGKSYCIADRSVLEGADEYEYRIIARYAAASICTAPVNSRFDLSCEAGSLILKTADGPPSRLGPCI